MGPLNTFHRGAIHGFVWVVALIAFSIATMPPAVVPAAPVARPTVRYTPPPIPTGVLEPVETTTAPVEDPDTGTDYVPLPDVDNDDRDWDKPRICHRRWWC